MALTEDHGMEKYFLNVNDEFRIGTHPNEKCMTALTELKSPNSVTERNANIRAIDAKYWECSCAGMFKATVPGRKRTKNGVR